MPSVKVTLDTRTVKKDGTSPIKLRISASRLCNFYISTGLSVEPSQWEQSGGRTGSQWVIQHQSKNALNSRIRNMVFACEEKLLTIHKVSTIATNDLKRILTNEIFGSDEEIDSTPKTFDEVFKCFLELKEGRTREIYVATRNKLRSMYPKYEYIELSDITKNWLTQLQNNLHKHNSINASAIHLRNIRAVYNYAIDEELVTKYPFRKFKIQTETTIKRSLSIEQLKLLRDYDVEGAQNEYRDLFFLIIYLIGINITDLCHLSQKDMINGRISYHRAKTNKLYSVKVEPEALQIIQKYSGKKHLICPLDRYTDLKQYNRRMNEGLQKIGPYTRIGRGGKKDIKPIIPGITTYWARHTWATIAHKIGIPKDVISMALGHSFGSRVTDVYIDYDSEKVDLANRQVIDYINGL